MAPRRARGARLRRDEPRLGPAPPRARGGDATAQRLPGAAGEPPAGRRQPGRRRRFAGRSPDRRDRGGRANAAPLPARAGLAGMARASRVGRRDRPILLPGWKMGRVRQGRALQALAGRGGAGQDRAEHLRERDLEPVGPDLLHRRLQHRTVPARRRGRHGAGPDPSRPGARRAQPQLPGAAPRREGGPVHEPPADAGRVPHRGGHARERRAARRGRARDRGPVPAPGLSRVRAGRDADDRPVRRRDAAPDRARAARPARGRGRVRELSRGVRALGRRHPGAHPARGHARAQGGRAPGSGGAGRDDPPGGEDVRRPGAFAGRAPARADAQRGRAGPAGLRPRARGHVTPRRDAAPRVRSAVGPLRDARLLRRRHAALPDLRGRSQRVRDAEDPARGHAGSDPPGRLAGRPLAPLPAGDGEPRPAAARATAGRAAVPRDRGPAELCTLLAGRAVHRVPVRRIRPRRDLRAHRRRGRAQPARVEGGRASSRAGRRAARSSTGRETSSSPFPSAPRRRCRSASRERSSARSAARAARSSRQTTTSPRTASSIYLARIPDLLRPRELRVVLDWASGVPSLFARGGGQ